MTSIVMVIPSLKKGGAEKIFSFLANNINKNKFKVYLILFDGANVQFDINENIILINLNAKGILSGAIALVRQIKRIGPDVVFSTITHLNILMGMLRGFLPKSKLVVRESSVASMNNRHQIYPALFDMLIKLFYKKLDIIICQSKDMADDLMKNFNIPQKNIVTINNPITNKMLPGITDRTLSTVNFISVGRLIPAKGFERLIGIVSKLEIDFKYVIVGGGDEYSNLKNKIASMKLQEKVVLAGEIDLLDAFYKKADFYLHGSYYEGFPNTLLEASSYGLPTISFNTLGGINEIIKEGFNGLIVDTEGEYYEAIVKALNYNWHRKSIQNDIYERFNKNKILSMYEDVLFCN